MQDILIFGNGGTATEKAASKKSNLKYTEWNGAERMAYVITTALEKGGTSKTTTVINIATLMAKDRKKVLVVDCDPQANCTYMLTGHKKNNGFFKGEGVYNMLRQYSEEAAIDNFVRETNVPGVNIIPSNAQTPMALGQLDLLAEEYVQAPYKFLAFCLAKVAADYDYILVDTPPSRDNMVLSALFAADSVLIPCKCDEFSMDGLETTLKMVSEMVKNEGMPIDILGILLTQVERTAVSTLVKDKLLESEYGDLLFKASIRKSSAVAESTVVAQPVVEYAVRSNPSQDYAALYKEIKTRIKALTKEEK